MNESTMPMPESLLSSPHGGAGTNTPTEHVTSPRATRIVRVSVPGEPARVKTLGRPTDFFQPAKADAETPYAGESLEDFIHREVPRLVERQLPYPPLTYVLLNQSMLIDGLWLEFGVYKGYSINILAEHTDQTAYGFDSFCGLPDDWRADLTKGRYDLGGNFPSVRENVELIAGWFDDTLPGFLETHPGNVALLHVDCDIYSSTRTVLTLLRERIVAGTVIVFDELFNYPEYREHELKAFFEFLAETGARFEWIGMKGPIEINPSEEFEHEFYEHSRGMGVRITSMP